MSPAPFEGIEEMLKVDYGPALKRYAEDGFQFLRSMEPSPPPTRAQRIRAQLLEVRRRITVAWQILRTGDDGHECW